MSSALVLRRAATLIAALVLVVGPLATPTAATHQVFIHEVQGSGTSSPLAGQTVTVEGVVVGDFQGFAALRGFFLQEEDADADADPSTSEGVFVFDGSFGVDVSFGQVVRVTGRVSEFFGLTQIGSVTAVNVVDAAAPEGLVQATELGLPLANAQREALEGMLVTAKHLFVTDTFNLHRFGEVWLASDGVVEQPTNELPPGDEMEALAASNMLRAILLDDGTNRSSPRPIPYLLPSGTLRVGDKLDELTAVMSFGFGSYRLQPLHAVFEEENVRPAVPDSGGDLTVASFNVLNYWTTLGGRGASNAAQLEVQTEKLVAAIREMDADVVGLQEIENDPTHEPITTLVAALNEAEGAEVWAWVGPTDHYNSYPIRNEIVYRIGAVTQVGAPDALADPAFDALNPSGEPFGRPPLAQTFEAGGSRFTVVVNHLKSKGSACGEPEEGADGQGNCNLKRVEQAEVLLDFVADLQAIDPDVLVIGDLNSYPQEDPISVLEAELTNIVAAHDEDPYSFNFFATFAAPFIGRGALDHALATPSMAAQVEGAAIWHINADEPRFLDWFDPALSAPGPHRSSDHDPVLIGLELDEDDEDDEED